MAINPGKSISTAKAIAIGTQPLIQRGQFTNSDLGDFYRLRLRSQKSSFSLAVKGLTANVDVELIRDRNHNGKVDLGEVVASSRAPQPERDSIDLVGLESGTYFVRVLPKAGNTRYRLRLSAQSTDQTSNTYEIVQRTNAFRKENGLPPLAVNTQLTNAAQAYAKSLAIDDNWSHTGVDGSTPWDRIKAAGYDYSQAAENLAAGHITPAGAIKGWINSPGHRANMLAYQVQEIGVGYYYQPNDSGDVTFKYYWAQDMGTPADVRLPSNNSDDNPFAPGD
jgi:uncharacterized protein YkwD